MKYELLLLFFVSFVSFSQSEDEREKEKYPSFFAIQLQGLANNKFFEASTLTNTDDIVTSSISSNNGFSFGGIIRRQFTDALGIELGVIHTKRFFNVTGSPSDTNTTYKNDFAFTNYAIPVNGLVFVKLSNEVFANAGLGVSGIYKPSSVLVKTVDNVAKRTFSFEGSTGSKFALNVNAQLGVEYRTRNKGIFYFGGSASIPLKPLFGFISVYQYPKEGIRVDQAVAVRSPYFTVDLRYYFPKIKNKGPQPLKGPIG